MRKKSFYQAGLVLLLLFISAGSPALFSQEIKYTDEVEKRISLVEKKLAPRLLAADSTGWTLQERMNFYNANGVSIAVISNYGIEWARGYGWADKSAFRPVVTTTLFQAGSISKSINSIGILKLVQDDRLNLYADINDYLQTWKFPYDSLSKGKKISAANLLSHTAGLTVHGFPGYATGTVLPTIPEILDGRRPANTAAVHSMFEPSSKVLYSGGGSTISQLLIADITGKPYDVFMWENVLKPLDMTNSFYTQPPPNEKQSMVATAYYNNGKEVAGKYHIYPEQAAAGLWTNPTDLAKYIIETQLSFQSRSNKVLSPEMTKIQLTPYIDSSAALGVFIMKRGGERYFTHGGVDEAFVSQYYGSVEGGNGVVVMANTYNTAILGEIINRVALVYNWKNFLPTPQRER